MNLSFSVLSSSEQDSEKWHTLLEKLEPKDQDIHFLPEYGTIYLKTYGYEPYLACYENHGYFVIQPFVKRHLNELPFLREQNIEEPFYDITNAYGFGGPLVCCDDPKLRPMLLFDFNELFTAHCQKHRIASEFTSLHPLLIDRYRAAIEKGIIPAMKQKDTVYIDLSLPEEKLWGLLRKGHKSSVRKAQKEGVRVEKVLPSPDNLQILNQLYLQTMTRNNAADRWYFPNEYFGNCYNQLGPEKCSFFIAFVSNSPAAACIVISAFDTVYYHFSGSDEQFFSYCANNLMVYEIALWAKRNGFKYMFLGGGVTSSENDSLFIFKAGFSKSRAPLYTYGRIHDYKTYEYLSYLKKTHEKAMLGHEIASDYFPLYRR